MTRSNSHQKAPDPPDDLGVGVGVARGVVGVGVTRAGLVAQLQSVLVIHKGFRQKPLKQMRDGSQASLLLQGWIQDWGWTRKVVGTGVGVAVARGIVVGVGLGVTVGVVLGLGVAVALGRVVGRGVGVRVGVGLIHEQSLLQAHKGFLQNQVF